MNWLRKNIWWILFAIPFSLILLSCFLLNSPQTLRFSIEASGHNEEFTIYEGSDQISYVFLPSYAKLENVYVLLNGDESISINGITLTNGMSCSPFSFETDYTLKYSRGKTGTLRFCKSENVASIHINTISGTMNHINADKNHKEQISVNIIRPDGTLECYDSAATIHGRGNSSWGANKKSYALQFSSETDVLSMGQARNWILLSNARDETQLRNKLAFEIARNAGMNWVPECQFVDVYLNGTYNGLYLLAEKVEIGPSRLNISPENGDFLCKVELSNRKHLLQKPFTTNSGRIVEVTDPDHNLYISRAEIEQKLNQLEKLLVSGADLQNTPAFDLDSWVCRYLIDEITGNADSDSASSYYYCYNNKIYGGPIWDYDYSLLPSDDGPRFIANQFFLYDDQSKSYYRALYANQSFYSRMVAIYEANYLPVLNEMLAYGIDHLASEIHAASEMNRLRWALKIDVAEGAKRLKSYLRDRVSFLNEAWLEGVVYHSVWVEDIVGERCSTFSVRDGDLFQTSLIDLENIVWIEKDTGKPFDPTQPIRRHLILVRQTPVFSSPSQTATEDKVTVLSIFVFIFIFAILISADLYYHHRRKGGILARWKQKRRSTAMN